MMVAVADTSALIDLAIPYSSSAINTTGTDDPLKVFLTIYDVYIPEKVEAEIGELWVGNDDLVATAAEVVLEVLDTVTIRDPLVESGAETIKEIPGLEPGEIHAIHLANHLSPTPEILVTSEFGGNYDSIIQDQLAPGIICKSTPELTRDLGAYGYLDQQFTVHLLSELADLKGWDEEYIGYLRYTLR